MAISLYKQASHNLKLGVQSNFVKSGKIKWECLISELSSSFIDNSLQQEFSYLLRLLLEGAIFIGLAESKDW